MVLAKIKKTAASLVAISLLALPLAAQAAGFGFDKTRLVLENGKTSGNFVIKNGNDQGLLMKAHIEDSNNFLSPDGKAVPKLFQIKGQNAGRVRVVINPKNLPKDRETQFWLYTKAFPEIKLDRDTNQVNVNFVTRLKVFYRPQGITTNIHQANKSIDWKTDNGKLVAVNNSPLNLTVIGLTHNGQSVRVSHMLKPYTQWETNIRAKKSDELAWDAINDDGGVDKNEGSVR